MTDLRSAPRRRVAEVMSSPPLLVGRDTTVADAAGMLYREGVGAVLVGTADDLVGILSERDVVRLVAHGTDAAATPVGDAMTAPVVHLEADDTLLDAVVTALDIGVRHLPVVAEGRVIGIVSVRDLVRPLLVEALSSH